MLSLYIGSVDYSHDALSSSIDSNTPNGRACISITLMDDDILENEETFTAVLSSTNGQVGDDNMVTVTINDNDGKIIIYSYNNVTIASYS